MNAVAEQGWLVGNTIRRARKTHRCDDHNGPLGSHEIEAGGLYVEGDPCSDRANGFGHYRFCLHCAGAEPSVTP